MYREILIPRAQNVGKEIRFLRLVDYLTISAYNVLLVLLTFFTQKYINFKCFSMKKRKEIIKILSEIEYINEKKNKEIYICIKDENSRSECREPFQWKLGFILYIQYSCAYLSLPFSLYKLLYIKCMHTHIQKMLQTCYKFQQL